MMKSVWIEQPVPEQLKRTYYYEDGSYIIKEGGTVAWRNNNEGNLRPGSLSSNRIGKDKKDFAVFATPEDGHEAKKYLLFSSSSYKNLTLEKAIKKYAPASDNNNPQKYANFIMKNGKVSSKLMSKYTSDEQVRIMSAMKKQEGYRAGSVTSGKVGTASKKAVYTNSTNPFDLKKAVEYNKKQKYSFNVWEQIQEKLNTAINAKLEVDGKVGKATTKAIYSYQAKNKLTSDGKCGNKTLNALGITVTSKSKVPSVKNKLKDAVSKLTSSNSSKVKIPSGATIMNTSYTPDLDLLYRHATQEGYKVRDIKKSANYVAKYCTSGSSQHQCTRGTSLMLQLASYARGEAGRTYASSCKANLFGSVNKLTKYNISSSVAGEYAIKSASNKTGKSKMNLYIQNNISRDGEFVTFKYATSQHIVFHSNGKWYSDFKQGTPAGCGNENTLYSDIHFFNI